jgi:hypothetical protein
VQQAIAQRPRKIRKKLQGAKVAINSADILGKSRNEKRTQRRKRLERTACGDKLDD